MKIMISAYPAGENCKYNGGNNRNEKVLQLMAENEVIAVCPAQMGGLPTPRVPSEIRNGVVTAKDGRIVAALRVWMWRICKWVKNSCVIFMMAAILLLLTACSSGGQVTDGEFVTQTPAADTPQESAPESEDADISQESEPELPTAAASQINGPETQVTDKEETTMKLKLGDTEVPVTWEKNDSVTALKNLAAKEPLTIQMSMYGGFEQVGPIGQSIVRHDQQTSTQAGDIVLYSGDQIVVFYGTNSWAYTRLGHVDLSQEELEDLLGNGDVLLTLQMED